MPFRIFSFILRFYRFFSEFVLVTVNTVCWLNGRQSLERSSDCGHLYSLAYFLMDRQVACHLNMFSHFININLFIIYDSLLINLIDINLLIVYINRTIWRKLYYLDCYWNTADCLSCIPQMKFYVRNVNYNGIYTFY